MSNTILLEARVSDIPEMHRVRTSVRENVLSDPTRVTPADYEQMMTSNRGKAWVYRLDGAIRGFSFADLEKRNLWALFVEPGFEGRGIGLLLHDCALGWMFENGVEKVWLTTDQNTRARKFYERAGWQATGIEGNECRLEIDVHRWNHPPPRDSTMAEKNPPTHN
jgi:GNAT superfamily N-acetyltransferase